MGRDRWLSDLGKLFGLVATLLITFSASLGFLWKDLALPEAIRAADAAGFDAVECHMPYEFDADHVNKTLAEMPAEANVLSLTVMATNMPFVGRG